MQKGDYAELKFTKYYHQKYVPVLLSSSFLREQGCGQIDLAYLTRSSKWLLFLIEIKQNQFPSSQQWGRLKKTQDYLSRILEIESKLEVKFCQKANDSLFS